VSKHLGDSASRRTALPLRGEGRNNEAVAADIFLVISGAKYALSRSPRLEPSAEERALHAYEVFFGLPQDSATLDQVRATSAGIAGFSTAEFSDWARCFHADATAGQRAELTEAKADAKRALAAETARVNSLKRDVNELEARFEAEAEAKGALEARLAESQAELEQLRRTTTAAADALQAEVRKGRRLIVLVSLTFALLAYVTLAAAEQLPGWFATASIPPELSAPAITLVVVLHVALLIGGATWALRLRLGPSPGLL